MLGGGLNPIGNPRLDERIIVVNAKDRFALMGTGGSDGSRLKQDLGLLERNELNRKVIEVVVSSQGLGIMVVDDLGEEDGAAHALIESKVGAIWKPDEIAPATFRDAAYAFEFEARLQAVPDGQPKSPVQKGKAAGEQDDHSDREIRKKFEIHGD
ncbi:uncharacterized protein N7484_003062 [Penicillium longicatenatum]|uniref:uncharacterized protein n=1 Tax=Penicillium longicatenatum TaxID=1561947 RepID=UPI00254691E1|nr:uncharacterized protein N7484_003062 [Penicillium longicatenatum]KAJ5649339.1 hypothetical protein N7484_003062 [Penicillium longicatenatum]